MFVFFLAATSWWIKIYILGLFTNRKSHDGFRLVPKSVTLDDLEQRSTRQPCLCDICDSWVFCWVIIALHKLFLTHTGKWAPGFREGLRLTLGYGPAQQWYIIHGRPQDFFQRREMRGSEGRKSSSRVLGQLPGGGLRATNPEADDIFSNWCINTSSTEVLDNICSKKHFQHFQVGDKCPLAHAWGRPWHFSCLRLTLVLRSMEVALDFRSCRKLHSKEVSKPWHLYTASESPQYNNDAGWMGCSSVSEEISFQPPTKRLH